MRRNLRPTLALGSTMLALLLAVQPVAAYTEPVETGHIGPYEFHDDETVQRGANCLYETGSSDLDKITVRYPFAHARDRGAGNQTQWVGWKYIIQRDADPFDGIYVNVAGSSYQKAQASETNIAQFTRRVWTAPESPSGRFRVKIIIQWYKPGSSSIVQGTVSTVYEWYTAKWNGNSYVDQEYCLEDY